MKKLFIPAIFIAMLIFSCEKEEPTTPSADALPCDYFETDRILTDDPNKDIDYIISCVMDINGKIEVNPGVVIQFEDASGLYVRNTGSFNTLGTSNSPIKLTAKNKVKGAWLGILFDSPSTQNQLTHTVIEYAGGGQFNSNGDLGSVILWDGAKLSANNLSIQHSGAYGLNATYQNATFTITESKINNCAKAPVKISPQYMSALGSTNDFTGNDENFVYVDLKDVDVDGDHIITNPSVPFRVFPFNTFQTNIRIRSGITKFMNNLDYTPTIMEFEDGTGIYVDDAGTLQTESEGDQMLFTGVNKTLGAWNGIFFQFSQGNNQLKSAVIEYAGATFDGKNAAIQMWGDPKLELSDADFDNIQGCAIMDRPKGANDPANPNLTIGSVYYNNVSGGNYCKQ